MPAFAPAEEREHFHQLVADARRPAVAAYVPALGRSGEWPSPTEFALDVEGPGLTPAGVAALFVYQTCLNLFDLLPRGDR